ncbi:UMP-CMP kinase [Tilletiaria anomala UBC 951]|uniref:Uridylate kinase n=1 Tax=Tilletiaria anomala (strain ATCC 24038 / CBS 436.72 / UBC 951) TaxID=1037660 RepID=A0A066VW84_TILAU|nr:UMP-CMP kinase [Tilletiaria anomala UBC 951]KDN45972.1 UMP-CMP kinase [Tilletiaria anomala UBC 951]
MAPTQEVRFDSSQVTVIFVLGGPGAGKGTQCENLVKDYDFVHLSAGDLLRAEQAREGSEYGQLIADYIKEGKIVPQEVTIALLRNAMKAALASPPSNTPSAASKWSDGRGRFLIDGFPRKMDQALEFDSKVCESRFVLFLRCTEEVMLERLLERGKTSGRTDDNAESIKKRFRTFEETSMPVVEYYGKEGKVVEVDSVESKEAVYRQIKEAMDGTFKKLGQEP